MIRPCTPDKEHECGCVTFWWLDNLSRPYMVFYRIACVIHRGYVAKLGLRLAHEVAA
jgi:hypothetical protein